MPDQTGIGGTHMAKAGRPSKLTPENAQRVLDCIRAGNYLETAAAYAGISKSSLFSYLRRGNRQRRGKYRDFLEAVERALAESEIRDVLTVERASKTDWKAAAWRLERKFPARWGRRMQVGSTGSSPDPARSWRASNDAKEP